MSNMNSTEKIAKISIPKNMSAEPYYLGLDIGTNSVGWAVSNKDYRIVNKNGKSLWGVRLFSGASTAAERRTFRSARRRRNRKTQRIKWLQEFFKEAINEKDPLFFQRLQDSFFYPDDKTTHQANSLFDDATYADFNYHQQYPTIYHLRQELIDNSYPHDVRLVYLACHHILKKRGHFLFSGDDISIEKQINEVAESFQLTIRENCSIELSKTTIDTIIQILSQTDINRTIKSELILQLFPNKDKAEKELSKLLSGRKTRIDILLSDEELKQAETSSINFTGDYETKRDELELILNERIDVLDTAYDLYNLALLRTILGDHTTISQANISIYERHARDLKRLKNAIRMIDKQNMKKGNMSKLYSDMFNHSDKTLDNYVAYSGHNFLNGKKIEVQHRCNYENFRKYIEKSLDPYKENENIRSILEDCYTETFLPKITSTNNAIIPHQLHAAELKKILANASSYLTFLTENVQKKIVSIINYRIPYYVGPLNDSSKFAWVERRSYEKTTPWNFDKIIDTDRSAEKFIESLTNKCTYLYEEDVLPKNSLLYSEFLVRDAINKLSISGSRLPTKIRDLMYEQLFLRPTSRGKVTRKKVVTFLKNNGLLEEEEQLKGMDLEIPAKLQAHHDFNRICPGVLKNRECEEIIRYITIYCGSPDLIAPRLKENFGSVLTKKQVNQLSKLRYKDWGRLSRKLLDGIYADSNGRNLTIINLMREEPLILMEVLSKEFAYSSIIDEHNKQYLGDPDSISYDMLDDFRISPAVKKMIWQALKICEEIFKIMKGLPEKIFIEVTREDGVKGDAGRTSSRKDTLKSIYRNCLKNTKEWFDRIDNYTSNEFRNDKLYLYFLQQGKCLYSGDPINIESLMDTNIYDVDHIYPRSLTKDDSLDNLALVKKSYNQIKRDTYPLNADWRTKNTDWWRLLLRCGYISDEKYKRLMGNSPLSDEIKEGFINRQLVETSQSSKAVIEMLKRFAPSSRVVYSKAGHVHDFRYRNGQGNDKEVQWYFPKVRELSDLHHAKDAYLNIVVGNAYNTKFSGNARWFIKNNPGRSYNLVKMFNYDIKGPKSSYAWIAGESGSIKMVKKMMSRNNIFYTYQSHRQKGGFFDQQIMKKGKGQYPLKTSIPALAQIDRYGAYNKVTRSHFALIEHIKGKKRKKTILPVPLTIQSDTTDYESKIINFAVQEGYSEPALLVKEIKYGSILEIDGVRYRLMGVTGKNIKCAHHYQPIFDDSITKQIKDLLRAHNYVQNTTINISTIKEFDKNNMISIFDMLINKLKSPPYCHFSPLNNIGRELEEKKETFSSNEISEQYKIILEILRLLQVKGQVVNLSAMYEKGATQKGMIRIPQTIKDHTKVSIVNQSVTGFFENTTDLNGL